MVNTENDACPGRFQLKTIVGFGGICMFVVITENLIFMSNSIQENKEIIIDLNSEYKIKIEDVKDFGTSIFKNVFTTAKEHVQDIIAHPESKHSYDSYNNIIAFTGERGKGKSSTMISFLRALNAIENGNEEDLFFADFYDNSHSKKAKYQFITLDVIDPSLFRGKESLFEIVLAKMFSLFKQSLEKGNSNSNSSFITDEERRELVKHFQNVFENLKYTTGNLKDELYKQEALDALIKLSTSSNLRESFQKLIKYYLKVLGKQEKCENFLVIAIDDFDLKIDGVYDMLEDVRRFLISQNIIILIACKMEQMRESIFNHIHKSLQYINNGYGNIEEISNKTNKYIEKIFSSNRTIPIEDTVLNGNKKLNNIRFNDTLLLQRRSNKQFTIDQILTFYGSDKLDIHFELNPEKDNPLLPKTLREFVNFVSINSPNDFYNYILNKCNDIYVHNLLSGLIVKNGFDFLYELQKNMASETSVSESANSDPSRFSSIENLTFVSRADIVNLIIALESRKKTEYFKKKWDYLYLVTALQVIISIKVKEIEFNIPERIFPPNNILSLIPKIPDIVHYRREDNLESNIDILKIFVQFPGRLINSFLFSYKELDENPYEYDLKSYSWYNIITYGFINKFDYNSYQSPTLEQLKEKWISTDLYTYFDDIVFLKQFYKTLQNEVRSFKDSIPTDLIERLELYLNKSVYNVLDRLKTKYHYKYELNDYQYFIGNLITSENNTITQLADIDIEETDLIELQIQIRNWLTEIYSKRNNESTNTVPLTERIKMLPSNVRIQFISRTLQIIRGIENNSIKKITITNYLKFLDRIKLNQLRTILESKYSINRLTLSNSADVITQLNRYISLSNG